MALENHSSFLEVEYPHTLNCWVEIMFAYKASKVDKLQFLFLFRQRRSCGSRPPKSHFWGHEIWPPYSPSSCSLLSLLNWCCMIRALNAGIPLFVNHSLVVIFLLWQISALSSWRIAHYLSLVLMAGNVRFEMAYLFGLVSMTRITMFFMCIYKLLGRTAICFAFLSVTG